MGHDSKDAGGRAKQEARAESPIKVLFINSLFCYRFTA